MKLAKHHAKEQATLAILVAAFVALQLFFANHTSFWGDELARFYSGSQSFSRFFGVLKQEGTPHGPFSSIAGEEFTRLLLYVHVPFHIAGRMLPLFLYIGAGLIPVFLSISTAWIWFLAVELSVPVFSFAVSSRPYIEVVFFSSCVLFYFLIFLERFREKKKPPPLLCALIALSGASYPHIDILSLIVISFIFVLACARKSNASLRLLLQWLAPLVAALLVTAIWQKGIRDPLPMKIPPFHEALVRLRAFHWKDDILESLHMLVGPGTPLRILSLFFIFGCVLQWRKSRTFATYLFISFFCGLLLPLFLDALYGYFFAPRQTFIALPALLYMGMSYFGATLRMPRLQKVACGILGLLFLVGWPWFHFLQGKSPYVDVPPYHLYNELPRWTDEGRKTLVVYSPCHLPDACVYRSHAAFETFRDRFMGRKEQDPCQPDSKLLLWTRNQETCFGGYVNKPDDPALLTRVKSAPAQYVFFWPAGTKRPKGIQGMACIDETGRQCSL